MADSIKKLSELFSQFPTVGKRTANRFVFYLISLPKEKTNEIISAIGDLKQNIKLCRFCFNPFEGQEALCEICINPARDRKTVCVVEKESDLLSIENTKRYKGLYFILGGNVFTLKKDDTSHLRTNELKERMLSPATFSLQPTVFTEVIVATNPTPEGKATSVLVERVLKELPQSAALKITHLAQGLPVGGELEYTDEETLESAFEGRK
jgi:recombination protein RecR